MDRADSVQHTVLLNQCPNQCYCIHQSASTYVSYNRSPRRVGKALVTLFDYSFFLSCSFCDNFVIERLIYCFVTDVILETEKPFFKSKNDKHINFEFTLYMLDPVKLNYKLPFN